MAVRVLMSSLWRSACPSNDVSFQTITDLPPISLTCAQGEHALIFEKHRVLVVDLPILYSMANGNRAAWCSELTSGRQATPVTLSKCETSERRWIRREKMPESYTDIINLINTKTTETE